MMTTTSHVLIFSFFFTPREGFVRARAGFLLAKKRILGAPGGSTKKGMVQGKGFLLSLGLIHNTKITLSSFLLAYKGSPILV